MSFVSMCNEIPAPHRMRLNGTGVDISEVSLRFVTLFETNNGCVLKNFGEYSIPEGVISLGIIKKPEVLQDILVRLQKEHQVKLVHASLPESLAYLSEIEIPTVKNSEIRGSIELQLEENIPIKIAEASFDYHVLDAENKMPTMTVIVSATPLEHVQSYVDVFEDAGISLLSLETDSTALSRAVIPVGSLEVTMIIDLGRTKTGVYIVNRGFVSFVSDIEIGGRDIVSAFIKEANLTYEDARDLYKRLEQNEKPDRDTYNIIAPIFSDLKEEISKHFIFWNTHRDKNGTKKKNIEKVVLCGSGATLFGLQEYLSSGLQTTIQIANVWENLFSFEKDIPKIPFHDSLKYSTAIGLAMYSKMQYEK